MAHNPLIALQDHGQSVWYDNISRELLASGELARLIAEDGVLGVTSNPTIFQKAISTGTLYDAEITRLAAENRPIADIYEALAIADIRAAADLLRPVYERTGGIDGYVSLEVSPYLAHDTAGTVAEARRLFATVARPNLMIKVPATPEGIPAVSELIAAGISVNVTLIFALSAYEAVAHAYIEGLEARARQGSPLHDVASVASFFISRVDTSVDSLLAGRPPEAELRGRAAVANACLAYARFQKIFAGPRWEALAARGRVCSDRCGPAPAPRTLLTRIPFMSTPSSAPIRSIPCRLRPWWRSGITAGWRRPSARIWQVPVCSWIAWPRPEST